MERWMEKNKDNGEKEKDLSAGYCLANKSKHLNLDQGRLDDAGFTKLEEREAWSKEGKVVQGGKYYYNRNRCNFYLLPIKLVITYQRSTLVAFTVGEKYQPGGEFKVLKRRKFKESYLLEHPGDWRSYRLPCVESETSFCQDCQRLHTGNVGDLSRPTEKFFRWQLSATVGGFGTPGLTGTSHWPAVLSWIIRCPPS